MHDFDLHMCCDGQGLQNLVQQKAYTTVVHIHTVMVCGQYLNRVADTVAGAANSSTLAGSPLCRRP